MNIKIDKYILEKKPISFLEETASKIYTKLRLVEKTQVWKLDEAFELFVNTSFPTHFDMEGASDEELQQKHIQFLEKLSAYFNRTKSEEIEAITSAPAKGKFRDSQLIEDQKKAEMTIDISIKEFIRENSNSFTTGLEVARIFHGLSSPKFPACDW